MPEGICRNAGDAVRFWFCQSYGNRAAELNAAGLCEHCACEAAWDAITEPPSFMRPEEEL